MFPRTTNFVIEHFDSIIIGGGPAGSQCATLQKLRGLKPCIIEKRSQLGGLQNDSPYPNEWIVASPETTGQKVAETIHNNVINRHKIPCFLDSTVVDVRQYNDHEKFFVTFVNKEKIRRTVTATFIVIASGTIPAAGNFSETKNLLIGPGHKIHHYDFKNKTVAILGGGDSAFENYEFIQAKHPRNVTIFARKDAKHQIKARQEFLARVPQIDVHKYSGVCHVDAATNTINGKQYDCIVVLYGWTVDVSFMSTFKLARDQKGFITTKEKTAETSAAGIYAIGEVAARALPCCATGMGDGVVAAKAIEDKLNKLSKPKASVFSLPFTHFHRTRSSNAADISDNSFADKQTIKSRL